MLREWFRTKFQKNVTSFLYLFLAINGSYGWKNIAFHKEYSRSHWKRTSFLNTKLLIL